MIELRALGTAKILTESSTITPSQTIAFAIALYMIMERRKPVPRARLVHLLWPSVKQTDQTHRLRQTVYHLKKLGLPLQSDRNSLELSETDVRTDIDVVVHTKNGLSISGDLEFLPGYAPNLSEGFHDWLDRTREVVHSSLTRTLLSALQDARGSGNWKDVEHISRNCLRLDAFNEAAILAQAEACAMRGQKATAVSILDRYVAELATENPALVLPAAVLRRRVLQSDDRRRATPADGAEPDFVGRCKEMATLTQLLEGARKGFGAACLIDGEPGIGKTRLSSELARFAELQGVTVQRVACKRSDTDQPLSAFVTLIPKLRELPGALGCSRESFTWLKRLTEFDASAPDLPAPKDDSVVIYTHLRSAVFDLLDAVSEERCLLIIVEDVQWLDRASATLFAEVLDWAPTRKIFFLFNSRESRSLLAQTGADNRMARMHLDRLGDHEATTLVRTMISASGVASGGEIVDRLTRTCDGNPFFLQELTKYWMESGEWHQIPPSVATILDERLSRLSDVSRQLLQTCAVLAEHSNLERVDQVLGHSPQDLLRGIQELSMSGMLRSTAPAEGATRTLSVRHDLLSIAVIKSLATESLAFLHRRCGLVLEREALGTSTSISLMRACAFHWHRSGDSERAYNLAIKCADHLLEIGLAEDAAAAFEGALGFCCAADRRLEVLGRIIQANRMAKNCQALLSAIARLRALQDANAPGSHHDDVEVTEFEARRTTDTQLGAVFSRTLACVYDATLPVAHRVDVAGVAVKLASTMPDLQELERVYSVINPLLDDATVGVRPRLQMQVVYHTMCGDLRQAVRFAKERVAFEREEGTIVMLVNAITDLAFVLRRAGPAEEMFEALQEGYVKAIEHKYFAAARDCAEKFGSLLEDEESPGSAEWMERAKAGASDIRDLHSNFAYNADAARIALRENRLDDARRHLDNDFDWEWVSCRRSWHAALLGLRIRLLIAQRSPTAAIAPHIETMRTLYGSTARLGRQDYELAALAKGLVYTDEPTQAKAYLEDYIAHTRRDLTPLSREITAIARSFGMTPPGCAGLDPTPDYDAFRPNLAS